MRMSKNVKKRIFLLALISCVSKIFAGQIISDFTQNKINEFCTLKIQLKSEDDDEAVKKIENRREKVISSLAEYAVDFEQEKRILESIYFMESYEHLITPEKRAELRKIMKNHMINL